ncbi:MAG: rhodanese-like domain-containing protein, partial [Gammaproteobacteria bacterium]
GRLSRAPRLGVPPSMARRRTTVPDDAEQGYALVNVLKPEAFEREHIPGSDYIPEGNEVTFEQRFSKDKEIIVYCASTDCHASDSVAEKLTKRGFTRVYDYAAGLRDWKQGGNSVETGVH